MLARPAMPLFSWDMISLRLGILACVLTLGSCNFSTAPEPPEFKLSGEALGQQYKARRGTDVGSLYAGEIQTNRDEAGNKTYLGSGGALYVIDSVPPIQVLAPSITVTPDFAETLGKATVKKDGRLYLGQEATKFRIEGRAMNKIAKIGVNNPPDPLDEITAPFEDFRQEAENWLDGKRAETEGCFQAQGQNESQNFFAVQAQGSACRGPHTPAQSDEGPDGSLRSKRPAIGGVVDELGLGVGGDAHLILGVATEEPDVGGILRVQEAYVAAAGLIDGEGLQDADGAVGRCDGTAPAPPVGDFGAALWLVAGAQHAPVHKGGAPGGFIVQKIAAEAAAFQIFEDAGVVAVGPFLYADFHDGDLHPRRGRSKTGGGAGSGFRWEAGDDAADGDDLAGKEDLPVAAAPFDESGIELLKLSERHAKGLRDLRGIVAGLDRVLGHGCINAVRFYTLQRSRIDCSTIVNLLAMRGFCVGR